MPGEVYESLKEVPQRFPQRPAGKAIPSATNPIARKYINPEDPETIIIAANQLRARTRAERPSTPPRFDSPMPDLALDSVNEKTTEGNPIFNGQSINETSPYLPPSEPRASTISRSNSFYGKTEHGEYTPTSPLFFQIRLPGYPQPVLPSAQVEEIQAASDTSTTLAQQQPVARGSRVNALRALRKIPTSRALDDLEIPQAENHELADIVNACAALNPITTGEPVIDIEHIAGSAAVALRRRYIKPPALDLTAIDDGAASCDTPEPLASRVKRRNMSSPLEVELQESQLKGFGSFSVSDIEQETSSTFSNSLRR